MLTPPQDSTLSLSLILGEGETACLFVVSMGEKNYWLWFASRVAQVRIMEFVVGRNKLKMVWICTIP